MLQTCQEIETFDFTLETICKDLTDTLSANPGVGIAAPQIGYAKRIVLIDPDRPRKGGLHDPLILINPKIVESAGTRIFREGCLSVPAYTANVSRFDTVVVEAFNPKGKPMRIAADQMLSIVLQHEIDHLDGRLFIHHVTSVKHLFLRKHR